MPGTAGLEFKSERHHVESPKIALVTIRANRSVARVAKKSPTLFESSIAFDFEYYGSKAVYLSTSLSTNEKLKLVAITSGTSSIIRAYLVTRFLSRRINAVLYDFTAILVHTLHNACEILLPRDTSDIVHPANLERCALGPKP